ncbi:hypothetical protein [Vibrio phage vB_pir03]|nr:hypothetical protein [Vibrio phage vB_pir03]
MGIFFSLNKKKRIKGQAYSPEGVGLLLELDFIEVNVVLHW